MKEQFEKAYKDLMASRIWSTWAMAGAFCLIAVVLRPLLFLLALVLFGRALYLAWPELSKKFNKTV